jgi:hypothetical protein
VYCLPEQVAVVLVDLASVDVDANIQERCGVGDGLLAQSTLDCDGCTDRCNGRREGDEKSVTKGLCTRPATAMISIETTKVPSQLAQHR